MTAPRTDWPSFPIVGWEGVNQTPPPSEFDRRLLDMCVVSCEHHDRPQSTVLNQARGDTYCTVVAIGDQVIGTIHREPIAYDGRVPIDFYVGVAG